MKKQETPLFTTEEKAQYEIFRNGTLPKETIAKWIKNDLSAINSLVHACLNDEGVFNALVEAYYNRYLELHSKHNTNDKP